MNLSIEDRGKFIVVYGSNNSGKSAALSGVEKALSSLNLRFHFIKYPIYDLEPTGPWLNSFLRGGNNKIEATQEEAQAIFAQNRRDFEPILRQILNGGTNVIGEDYTDTGRAWGETWGVSPQRLLELNDGLLEPDLSILIFGRRFIEGVETNHKNEQVSPEIWKKNQEIHRRIGREKGWIEICNQGKNKDEIASEVSQVVTDFVLRRPMLKPTAISSPTDVF